jgi:hypothetical protein
VSIQEIMTTGVVFMGPILSLVAPWLRLRFQVRSERERRQYLLILAAALPAGSRIQEHRCNGTRLILIVGATQRNEE